MLDILPFIVILGLGVAAYFYYRHYNSQKTDNTDISSNGVVGETQSSVSHEDTSGAGGNSGDNP